MSSLEAAPHASQPTTTSSNIVNSTSNAQKRTFIDLTIDSSDEDIKSSTTTSKRARTNKSVSDDDKHDEGSDVSDKHEENDEMTEVESGVESDVESEGTGGEGDEGDEGDEDQEMADNATTEPEDSESEDNLDSEESIRDTTPAGLRAKFLCNLEAVANVTLVNDIDDSSPPVDFRFVEENVLGTGVTKAPDEYMSGCNCKPENGRQCGCEYTICECLQDSAATANGRKAFPYFALGTEAHCLRPFYRKSRHHIFECNAHCNCGDNCKNKTVQFGRKVPVEIFKTTNRGWGLRCTQDLKVGQFVDTYRGEVITNMEALQRGEGRTSDQENYFFDLDKFIQPEKLTKADFLEDHPKKRKWHGKLVKSGEYKITKDEDGNELWQNPDYEPTYVIDGMQIGGPTRFVNHSCEPNCHIHTASYNHADIRIYDIAFFAAKLIPAGTELTFDYKNSEDQTVITDKMADDAEAKDGARPQKCLCGSGNCRGYFFN